MFFSGLFCCLNQSEKLKYKPPTHINFSQNLDENLKTYMMWPKENNFLITRLYLEACSSLCNQLLLYDHI